MQEENKIISSFRVRVEHAIAGIKRFGVVSQTLRNRKAYFDDLVMEISCGMQIYGLIVFQVINKIIRLPAALCLKWVVYIYIKSITHRLGQ